MLSIVAGVQEYIQAMVDRVSGMKVMILDSETIGIISMVFSQSDILQHEVFLVERIDQENEEQMRHLNAICFLRPTTQNFLFLSKILKSPNYNEYHVFFTNVVPHMRLEQLAFCDEFEVVHQVHEFFADVYAINHDLFSLNQPSTIRLIEDQCRWTSYEESVFDRTVEGLLAACLNLRMLPAIRYTASSELTQKLAHRLQTRITEEFSLFDLVDRGRKGEACPVLLLVDRRNDPVTPLLNQWTYQAMLHELLGMENNRIDMSKVPGIRPELKEIVMSTTQDQFFEENILANFGDLGIGIKKYVEDYQKQTKNTAKIESIEEMQRFVDEYPEFRRMSGNVSKHVAVVHELSRIVQENGLMDASALEQEIACSENRQDHLKQVTDLLRGTSVTNMERLRLVLLYALRYEHSASIEQLKDVLRSKGIAEQQVALVDQVLRYAGSHARSGDLFGNKSFLAQARSKVANSFKGVENVYTQHKTHLASVVDNLMKGRLKESSYPFIDSVYASPSKEQLPRAIVFVVGGTCFEEARDIHELNKTLDAGRCVILGGTTVHNSRSFLAEITQLMS
eukprot:TRINITY_DN19465_c0_g3_i1.p1 TRINITY_DN19465_c0_g3~~TRINITY_DN19465_c0_g3_i1.p1  ORF type:complete len:566 (+),score=123.06 TRINITY_DN19465_c0_g3_i1:79-1776(+)